jgi:oligopeptide/dipeptide ABC transporter ATP-binding protein
MDGSVPHQPLLSVENLYVQFHTLRGVVHALDGVSLAADHRQAIGLVGETGCGKSVTARAILRLIEPPGRIVDGAVRFEGRDLMALSDGEIRDIRGARISMILQEPRMSLNPVMRAGDQVAETLLIHDRSLGWRAARRRSLDMLAAVSIPDPGRMARRYPHELSGGMAQRIMIAMMLVTQPKLLIADEPTSALDVTIQAQILDLITHDLGIVAETCDRVVVMYAGQVVETGPVAAVLRDPQHPYTSGLLKTLPEQAAGDQPLYSIEGNVPSLLEPPRGCRFAARCEHVMDRCWGERPPSYALSPERQVACFLHAPG